VDDFVEKFMLIKGVCPECGSDNTKCKMVNKVKSRFKILQTCLECKHSEIVGEGNLPEVDSGDSINEGPAKGL